MCTILDYEIKMTRPVFRTLVSPDIHFRMRYTRMIGTMDLGSRP